MRRISWIYLVGTQTGLANRTDEVNEVIKF